MRERVKNAIVFPPVLPVGLNSLLIQCKPSPGKIQWFFPVSAKISRKQRSPLTLPIGFRQIDGRVPLPVREAKRTHSGAVYPAF